MFPFGPMNRAAQRLLGIVSVLAAWQTASWIVRSPFVPGLQTVLLRAIALRAEIYMDVVSSVSLVLIGFAVAVVFGFAVGLLTSRVSAAERVLAPVVDLIRPVPALALFPLFIAVLGLGVTSRAVVVFWTAWPAVALNTFQAIRQVDRDVVGAARIDGAGEWALLSRVMVPIGAQTMFAGLRLAMGGAWISVVVAEMLGANAGLGFFVLIQSNSFDFPAMYAGVILIALVGLALNRGLVALQKLCDYGGVYAEVSDRGPARRGPVGLVGADRPVRGFQGLRSGVRGDRQGFLS